MGEQLTSFARPEPALPADVTDAYRARGLWSDARIGWAVTSGAERWDDWTALVFQEQRWSYRELWRWITTVAHQLVDAGLRPGDRLVWQCSNSVEALVLHMAGWRVGLVCVPVVPIYREHEMKHILTDARPSAVAFSDRFGSRQLAAEMDALIGELGIDLRARFVVGGAREGWDQLAPPPSADAIVSDAGLPDPAPADEPCLVLYTSGTTAAPKGALHSSTTLVAEANTLGSTMGFSFRDVFVMGAPITHIAGLLLTGIVPATFGCRSVLLPAWDPDLAVRLCHEERGTFSCGATVFLQAFVERYERDEVGLHRLGAFMCGGSSVPPSLIERADAVGIRAFRSWGMTEVPTIGLIGPSATLQQRAYTDGRASAGTEVHAVDDEGKVLPPGEMGELRVRAPEQMLGYTDPVRHREHVDEDGWFRTGDVGYVDADGWITMTGRIKDIINRGGEKFSAQDIEHAIVDHPAIREVAVTGVPDERLGEAVVAFVTLHEPWPGRAALLEHLEKKRLAKQKMPVAWRILDELPMTLSGKTQKNRLLQLWEDGLAQAPEPE